MYRDICFIVVAFVAGCISVSYLIQDNRTIHNSQRKTQNFVKSTIDKDDI